MAERHPLDVEQLTKALVTSISLHCDIQRVIRSESHVTFIINQGSSHYVELQTGISTLESLSSRLRNMTGSKASTDPESFVDLLANIALTASNVELKAGYAGRPNKTIETIIAQSCVDFVIVCIVLQARLQRHAIPIARIPADDLREALANRDRPALIRTLRFSLGLVSKQVRNTIVPTVIPRAFIATPLTHLDDDSHQIVLQLARKVQRLLTRLGMVVINPDPKLTPSTTTDSEPNELSKNEQLLITGSDLVVAVGAEHESWGISRSVSWAEGCCSIVVVATTAPSFFVSRVLDSTPHRTYRQDAEEDPDRLLGRLEKLFMDVLPIIEHHARDRIDMSERLREVLQHVHRRLARLDKALYEQSLLTRERALELVDHPVIFNHASLAEVRALRQLLGDALDEVIGVALGRSSNPGDRTVRSSVRALSGQSYANLQSAAQLQNWTHAEVLRLIDEHLNPVQPLERVFHNRTVSAADWRRAYERINATGYGFEK